MSYRLASPTKSNPAKSRIIQCPPGFFRTSSESIQATHGCEVRQSLTIREDGREIRCWRAL
ncbi:TPA: hypothetical protein GFX54_04420 [Escherichia coli]|nr:hypothetical protein [Escherichia coli]HAH0860929.1 hypothetical protein [Escherichia coli]